MGLAFYTLWGLSFSCGLLVGGFLQDRQHLGHTQRTGEFCVAVFGLVATRLVPRVRLTAANGNGSDL